MCCKTDAGVELVMGGMTLTEAAKVMRISKGSLATGLKRRGLSAPVKGKRGRYSPGLEAAIAAVQNGSTAADACRANGIWPGALSIALKKRNMVAAVDGRRLRATRRTNGAAQEGRISVSGAE